MKKTMTIAMMGSALFLTACMQQQEPNIGPFTATYYVEGNTQPVATEQVERPALQYAYNEFKNIPAQNLHATWEADFNLGNKNIKLPINFDLSWSDVEVFLDGKSVKKSSNSIEKIELDIPAGNHTLKIDYHNNWQTVGFNTSFINYTEVTKSQAKNVMSKLMTKDTKVAYIGAYEPKNRYNKINLKVTDKTQPTVLFLGSYSSANWHIEEADYLNLQAIVVTSCNPSSTINGLNIDVPIFNITDMKCNASNDNELQSVQPDIQEVTGAKADYMYAEYALDEAVVPKL